MNRKGFVAELEQAASAEGSAVDRVTAAVRRSILDGTLPPGSSFSITDLSEKLGVSPIPVREALRRLDAQGLIVLRPGRSAMVGPLDAEELRAIYRLRRTLEPGLAARSCNLHTAEDFVRMDALVEAYGKPEDDAEARWQVHHDLHVALLSPAASSWDLRVLEQLWHAGDRYTRIVFETYDVGESERRRRHVAHRVLVQAARSGSPFEIRQALEDHLADNEAACLLRMAALPTGKNHIL